MPTLTPWRRFYLVHLRRQQEGVRRVACVNRAGGGSERTFGENLMAWPVADRIRLDEKKKQRDQHGEGDAGFAHCNLNDAF